MKHLALVIGLLLSSLAMTAHEGMWLPTLLASIHDEMAAEGLKLTPEQIYSVNQSSLKDAIALFGGGCTAEVISNEGLILTNHHCGYGTIQRHSSLEHDYLKNGFWAMDRAQELQNPGLSATFIVRIEDVTKQVLANVTGSMSEQQRNEAIALIAEELTKTASVEGEYSADIRPFYYGNAFYMIVSQTFKDVRLVGAPPSSIGKFGADTDNWVWPRHTGDFSLFRIYTDKNGAPAEPAADNIPYKPKHVLPIAMEGPQEGEFAMVYGFPGTTQQYLPAVAVKHVVEVQDPMRIRMREASLSVIDAAMRASDKTRIQYASRQSGISNAYKKWIGEMNGLTQQRALEKKMAREKKFMGALSKEGTEARYGNVLAQLEQDYAEFAPYITARDLFIEFVYYGPEILRFVNRFETMATQYNELKEAGKLEEELEKLRSATKSHFKDYDAQVDEDVYTILLPLYTAYMPMGLRPDVLLEVDKRYKGVHSAYTSALYAKSIFASQAKLELVLKSFNAGAAKKMIKDPAFVAQKSFYEAYFEKVRPSYNAISDKVDLHMRTWMQAQMEVLNKQDYWPDANSTLRLSYGRVEGSAPNDGMLYKPFTTLEGVMQKYIPGNYEFDVPQKLMDLYQKKDYGPYGDNGEMNVCFTASLHTTGGNSGSPVLNGKGELIGLNFDRSWESTMSDIMFDPSRCRNIAVDIRYVLFIIDKFAGAKHLVEEMELTYAKSFDEVELETP